MTATAKQISYAMHLLGEAGYSTRYMDASFRQLGAKMSQRSGSVRDWLTGMTRSDISTLIDQLS